MPARHDEKLRAFIGLLAIIAIALLLNKPGGASSEVTLLAVGDIMLDMHVEELMKQYGPNYPWQYMRGIFSEADIVLGNLEGPISANPQFETTTDNLRFCMDPVVAPAMRANGITHLSLANNHTFLQGEAAFEETKTRLQNEGIAHFGHPQKFGRGNVAFNTINHTRFAFIGFQTVTAPFSIEEIQKVTEWARTRADIVIAFPHWGVEYQPEQDATQIELAHALIDSGADIVLGHHPHVVQPMEVYRNHAIFYSLGNFIFDQYWSEETQKGLMVKVKIKDRKIELADITAHPIDLSRSQPRLKVPK